MVDRVRFVHAADLHLDAPFQGISAADEVVGAALAAATLSAFDAIVDICLTREVDFLVIAGDAFHSSVRSLGAQRVFQRGLQRLADADVAVFLGHGNHDPATGWGSGFALPENVRVFPTSSVGRFEFERDGELVAAVYGRSFAKSAEKSNFAAGYHRQSSDPIAIGVLHANVGGHEDYDPYAPATLDDLRGAGMDYWALGHIHKHEVLMRDPWAVYPGSPQGLNPKETGAHGCMVVEVARGGTVTAEHVETAPVVWEQGVVTVDEDDTLDRLTEAISAYCERARTDAGRPVVVRLSVAGRSSVHAELAAPGALEALLGEVRYEQTLAQPWVWIDQLVDATSSVVDIEAVRAGSDFAAELVRMADEMAEESEALDALVRSIAEPLAKQLGHAAPVIDSAAALEKARDAALDLLLAEGGDVR